MLQIWTYDIEPNVDNYCNNFLGKNKTILQYTYTKSATANS